MKNNEIWKPILNKLNFSIEKYDDLIKYIEWHIKYESNINTNLLLANSELEKMITLPMALKLLSKLDLNKIHFIDTPMLLTVNNTPYRTDELNIYYQYDYDELKLVDDINEYVSMQLIDKSFYFFYEKLKSEYVYIYKLFNDIKKIDNNQIRVTHRFFTSKEKLDLKKSYLIFYLKSIEKEGSIEVDLKIEEKIIPEEKKESFLKFLDGINRRIPREDELNEWMKSEDIN